MYIFGSQASGRTTPSSDVDVAVLTERAPSALERLDIAEDLSGIVGRDVDLVILDDASPIIAMQVLRSGQLVIDADPHARAELEIRTLTAYADLKRVRQSIEQALARRMSNG